MTGSSKSVDLLRANLEGAGKVASRLKRSLRRVSAMMPLDAVKIDSLTEDEEERFDAFIFRFNSLTAMVQDHITRGILLCEEEDARVSKKDQRHLMEKLGALKPELNFGTLAELRNRIAHHYPDDTAKQAEIIDEVYARSGDLLAGYNTEFGYANSRIFGGRLTVARVES